MSFHMSGDEGRKRNQEIADSELFHTYLGGKLLQELTANGLTRYMKDLTFSRIPDVTDEASGEEGYVLSVTYFEQNEMGFSGYLELFRSPFLSFSLNPLASPEVKAATTTALRFIVDMFTIIDANEKYRKGF
jgi:hypothetical protein